MSGNSEKFVGFFGRRVYARTRCAIHYAITAAAVLFTFICADGKLSLTGFESGSEDVAAVVQVAQPFQARPRHVSEPIYTAHHHASGMQVDRSIADSDIGPLQGHRLPNGLNAPLRS
jgi:hypothetical protein